MTDETLSNANTTEGISFPQENENVLVNQSSILKAEDFLNYDDVNEGKRLISKKIFMIEGGARRIREDVLNNRPTIYKLARITADTGDILGEINENVIWSYKFSALSDWARSCADSDIKLYTPTQIKYSDGCQTEIEGLNYEICFELEKEYADQMKDKIIWIDNDPVEMPLYIGAYIYIGRPENLEAEYYCNLAEEMTQKYIERFDPEAEKIYNKYLASFNPSGTTGPRHKQLINLYEIDCSRESILKGCIYALTKAGKESQANEVQLRVASAITYDECMDIISEYVDMVHKNILPYFSYVDRIQNLEGPYLMRDNTSGELTKVTIWTLKKKNGCLDTPTE